MKSYPAKEGHTVVNKTDRIRQGQDFKEVINFLSMQGLQSWVAHHLKHRHTICGQHSSVRLRQIIWYKVYSDAGHTQSCTRDEIPQI